MADEWWSCLGVLSKSIELICWESWRRRDTCLLACEGSGQGLGPWRWLINNWSNGLIILGIQKSIDATAWASDKL